jgi:hypothetical protein
MVRLEMLNRKLCIIFSCLSTTTCSPLSSIDKVPRCLSSPLKSFCCLHSSALGPRRKPQLRGLQRCDWLDFLCLRRCVVSTSGFTSRDVREVSLSIRFLTQSSIFRARSLVFPPPMYIIPFPNSTFPKRSFSSVPFALPRTSQCTFLS